MIELRNILPMTALLLCASVATAQQPAAPLPDAKSEAESKPGELAIPVGEDFVLTPSGQYMLRFRHHDGHNFVDGGNTNTFRHRARLGVEGMFKKRFGVFAQVQDVRLFGEETNTLGDFNADGLDMHQAYARVFLIDELELRAGRQEIAWHNHRLIGTVGWIEQARSFDAIRGIFTDDLVKTEAFFARIAEDDSATLDPATGLPLHSKDRNVAATYVQLTPIPEVSPALVLISDTDEDLDGSYTVGGIVSGKTTVGLSYSAEAYYQIGDPIGPADDRSAFMLGAMTRMDIDVTAKPFVGIVFDFVSGDNDQADTKVKAFDTLYATNHKFYGEMDFFLNLPVHTQGRGLMDVSPSLGFKPLDGGLAQVTFHHFRAATDPGDGLATFGNELDIKLAYSPWKQLTFDLVYALFSPGDVFKAPLPDSKIEHFSYTTLNARF
jgi:hypothetical protein